MCGTIMLALFGAGAAVDHTAFGSLQQNCKAESSGGIPVVQSLCKTRGPFLSTLSS